MNIEEQIKKTGNIHLKERYSMWDMKSFKDVPGWINDAETVFPKIIHECKDGDHVVELGTYLGQSGVHMCDLIKKSKKNIKFDSIDIFWLNPIVFKNWKDTNTPEQFWEYINQKEFQNMCIMDIIKHPFHTLGLIDYVNFITCDTKYAHNIYKSESLKLVWVDANHSYESVYSDLVNFWPKIQSGGYIAGDDYDAYPDVKYAVNDFIKITKNIAKTNFYGNCFEILKK